MSEGFRVQDTTFMEHLLCVPGPTVTLNTPTFSDSTLDGIDQLLSSSPAHGMLHSSLNDSLTHCHNLVTQFLAQPQLIKQSALSRFFLHL